MFKKLCPWAIALLSGSAAAAPNEIKVFTDELASYREHTLETHVNKAGRTIRGAESAPNPLRVMPEYSYGIWRNWELSLQLPFAFSGEASKVEGYRAELQYVAPHDADQGFYWGVNVELARDERLGEASFINLELIPIIGYRVDRWHLAANPGMERALTGPRKTTHGTPAVKAAYRAYGRNYVGVEYYVEPGQSRTLYVAWDGKLGGSDFNIGIGRGSTDAPDRWVLKMIYEIGF